MFFFLHCTLTFCEWAARHLRWQNIKYFFSQIHLSYLCICLSYLWHLQLCQTSAVARDLQVGLRCNNEKICAQTIFCTKTIFCTNTKHGISASKPFCIKTSLSPKVRHFGVCCWTLWDRNRLLPECHCRWQFAVTRKKYKKGAKKGNWAERREDCRVKKELFMFTCYESESERCWMKQSWMKGKHGIHRRMFSGCRTFQTFNWSFNLHWL